MNNSILELLEELEREVSTSKKSMMSGNRMVDEYRVMDIISAIRDLLPTEIVTANVIVRDKNEVVASAQAQAEKIIREARIQADRLVSESAVVTRAAHDADMIIRDANNYKKYIMNETRAGLDELFKSAEFTLTSVLKSITESRDGMHEELDNQAESHQEAGTSPSSFRREDIDYGYNGYDNKRNGY